VEVNDSSDINIDKYHFHINLKSRSSAEVSADIKMLLKNLKLGICAIAALTLVGCMNTTKEMRIDTAQKNQTFKAIEAKENKATFALAKLLSDIKRDDPIFAFPSKTIVQSMYCNYGVVGDGTVTYTGGKQYLGDWSSELGEVFFETFERLGYNVAGNPNDLFGQNASVASAEYLVGGRLIKSQGNICHLHHWWDGRPLYEFGGEFSLTIEWSVLNTLTKSVVVKETSTGTASMKTPEKNGISALFESAFADAADGFARSDKMRKLATGEKLATTSTAITDKKYSVQTVDAPGKFDSDALRPSVATIRVGMGHGSGFFIGTEGLILTNAHVVGEARTVQIVTSTGLEVSAEVLVTDKGRDVALLKAPIRMQNALSLQTDTPSVAEDVYAVGTPMKEELKTTVTKGIVSAIRTDNASGMSFIQSDAAISPGNSGGPLFNGEGQVVAISVAKFTGGGAEGLGLFIPLAAALDALGVEVK